MASYTQGAAVPFRVSISLRHMSMFWTPAAALQPTNARKLCSVQF